MSFTIAPGITWVGKKVAAFGSCGWSGESVKLINARLEEAGFALVDEGLRNQWNPDSQALESCINFGTRFAEQCPFPAPPTK